MLLLHQVPSTPGYTDEERQQARAEGADLIRRAAAFGADPLVRQYAATLITDHATEQLARQFLESFSRASSRRPRTRTIGAC
jgi:hypothetical protein